MQSRYLNVITLFQRYQIISMKSHYRRLQKMLNYRKDQHNFKITKWGLGSHCFNIQSQNLKFSKQFKNKQIK